MMLPGITWQLIHSVLMVSSITVKYVSVFFVSLDIWFFQQVKRITVLALNSYILRYVLTPFKKSKLNVINKDVIV